MGLSFFLFYYLWVYKFDSASRVQFKLPSAQSFKIIALICAADIVIYCIANMSCGILPWQMRIVDEGSGSLIVELVSAISIATSAAFIEEVIYRGFLLRWLLSVSSVWLAVFTQAAFFAISHGIIVEPGDYLRILQLVSFGLVLGIAYLHFRSIWAPVTVHFFWDFFRLTTDLLEPPAFLSGALVAESYADALIRYWLITEIILWMVVGFICWLYFRRIKAAAGT
jgi:membrane protease YdiL (CAAX protease family)